MAEILMDVGVQGVILGSAMTLITFAIAGFCMLILAKFARSVCRIRQRPYLTMCPKTKQRNGPLSGLAPTTPELKKAAVRRIASLPPLRRRMERSRRT